MRNIIADFNVLLKLCANRLNVKPHEIREIVASSLNDIVEGEVNIKNNIGTGKIKQVKGYYIFEERGKSDDPLYYRKHKTIRKRNRKSINKIKLGKTVSPKPIKQEVEKIEIREQKYNEIVQEIEKSKKRTDILYNIFEYKLFRKGDILDKIVNGYLIDRLEFKKLVIFIPFVIVKNNLQYKDYFENIYHEMGGKEYFMVFDDHYNPRVFSLNPVNIELIEVTEKTDILEYRRIINEYKKKLMAPINGDYYGWIQYDVKKMVIPRFKISNVGKTLETGNICKVSLKQEEILKYITMLPEKKLPKIVQYYLMSEKEREAEKEDYPVKSKHLLCMYLELLLRHLTETGFKCWLNRFDYGLLKLKLE